MTKSKRIHIAQNFIESKYKLASSYSAFKNYYSEIFYCYYSSKSIEYICKENFDKFPFPGNYLNYYNYYYSFSFPSFIGDKDIDIFLNFCEFLLNFVRNARCLEKYVYSPIFQEFHTRCELLNRKITETLDNLGYEIQVDPEYKLFYCVEKNTLANNASEIDFVKNEPSASYKIIEYNRINLRGDILRKREILQTFCRIFESKRSELSSINKTLESNLGFNINTFDIRHNNTDEGSKSKKEYVSKLSSARLEKIYDMTYDLFLQAFISLDNSKYDDCIKDLIIKSKSKETN